VNTRHLPSTGADSDATTARQRASFPIGAGIGLLIGFGAAFLAASLWTPPPPIPGSPLEDDLIGLRARVHLLERETPAVTVHSDLLVAAAQTAVATALPELVDNAYREAAVNFSYSEDHLRDDVQLELQALVEAEVARALRTMSAAPRETTSSENSAIYAYAAMADEQDDP
jgi:hypothetical protein